MCVCVRYGVQTRVKGGKKEEEEDEKKKFHKTNVYTHTQNDLYRTTCLTRVRRGRMLFHVLCV